VAPILLIFLKINWYLYIFRSYFLHWSHISTESTRGRYCYEYLLFN